MYLCKSKNYLKLFLLSAVSFACSRIRQKDAASIRANTISFMKKHLWMLLVLSLVFWNCDQKSKVEKAVEAIPVQLKVHRFEKAFFGANAQTLPQVKQEYPFFFPPENDDRVWLDKIQNPQWRELYSEVEKRYGDFSAQTQETEDLFRHIKYYFPKTPLPQVYTIIAEMDYQTKIIYTRDKLIIPLELYLGRDHRFYEFPQYLKEGFEPRQILPDIVAAFAPTQVPPPAASDFLSQMIYYGKILYLKDLLLPDYTDAERIGYSPAQIQWSQENEAYVWRYFIERNLLYSTEQKLLSRFIYTAPFSKFYLEIDNESPGRIGTWIGWQIVRSYMKNNEVSLQTMLRTDAKQIFEQSHYKPKKDE